MRTEQEKEIGTIKGRNLVLQLSDADVNRLFEKAASVGLTAEKLLENFIGDLVDGTYSNGSDERMYADEWFCRCGFEMSSEYTLLRHLINWGLLDSFLESHESIQTDQAELADYEQMADKDADDLEEMDCIRENIGYHQKILSELYDEYLKVSKNGSGKSLKEAAQEVLDWEKSREAILNS